MAKLRDIAKGTRNFKSVPFRVANADTLAEGQEWQTADDTIQVGLRALTPAESSEVLAKAQESALRAGAKEWLATHPLCELHLMVHLVAAGCVDNEKRDEPFVVGGAEEIFKSPELAGDNLAYLAQQVKLHNDSVGPRDAEMTAEQLIGAIVREAERPENAPEAFFSLLRPSSQLSCFRSMAKLLSDLLTSRSLSFALGDTFSPSSETTPSPEAAAPAASEE